MKRIFEVAALAVVCACWLSAGARPFVDAAVGVRDPADLARDYVSARVRLEHGRGALPAGEDGNAWATRFGVPLVGTLGGPYYIHPPPAALLVLPLGALRWRTAAFVWATASALALGWLSFLLLVIWSDGRRPAVWKVGALMVTLLLWPPVLHGFEKGQWSIWIAAFLAAGFRALEDEPARSRQAGVFFGLAAALKLTPLVLGALLLVRDRRAAGAMAATFIGLGVLAWPVAPWPSPGAFAINAALWAPWLANTASLDGIYARLFSPNPYAHPLMSAPALGRAAFLATGLALFASAIAVAWRSRKRSNLPAKPAAHVLGAWLTLPVLLNPLGWSHVLVLLLAPLVILARDETRRSRIAALVLLAVFTIPRQRLATWAGPTPVTASGGLWLGAQALAAVVLFVWLLGFDAYRQKTTAG